MGYLIALLFVLVSQISSLHSVELKKCNFSQLQEPLKTFALAFKESEKLSLDEKISPNKNKAVELIFRSHTRYWKAFDWKLRPLEFFAVLNAEENYLKQCESKRSHLLSNVLEDLERKKISFSSKHSAMNTLLLLMPCLEDPALSLLQAQMAQEFVSNTESFLTYLVAADSDTSRYLKDYQACSMQPYKKFQIVDRVLFGIERHLNKNSFDRSLILRLKKLRASKMHFESARYFFEKVDALLSRNSTIEKR